MKTPIKHIILVAAAVLAAISCVKDPSPVQPEGKVFTAYFANGTDKAYIDSCNDLHWHKADKISIFGTTTNECYVFNGITGDNGGTFTKQEGGAVSPSWSKYYSIYPYTTFTTAAAEGDFTVTLPEVQHYTSGSFDPDAALMVATTQDIASNELKFRHTCAYLKVKIYSTTNAVIRKLILTGNNYECLSGTGRLTVDSEGIPSLELSADFDNVGGNAEGYSTEPGTEWDEKVYLIGGEGESFDSEQGTSWDGQKESIGGAPESYSNESNNTTEEASKSVIAVTKDGNANPQGGSRRIVLDCGENGVRVGSTKETATTFVIAIAPNNFTNGFKITTVDVTGGETTKSTSKSLPMPRASIMTMAAYEVQMEGGGMEFTSFSLSTVAGTKYEASIGNSTLNLVIPDSVDKSALIATFTTTGKEVYVGSTKQQSGVTANDFSEPVTYIVKNAVNDSKEYTVRIQSAPKLIACWGDSFTHYGNDITCYPPRLQEQLGSTWTVYDGGISGDYSNEIAARQGAIKTIIRKEGGVNFPTTTEAVGITTVCTDDATLDPEASYKFRPGRWTYGTRGLNNCIVAGVECQLAYNSLKRVKAGESVHVDDRTPITTYGAAHCKDADVIVIYMGTNGGWQHNIPNYDLLIAQHQAMIDFTTNKKYIILASHISHGFTFHGGDNTTYLTKLKDAFGNHVIFLRSEINNRAEELLVKTGVYKSASEISDADRQYIAKGDWPLSFFCSASDEHPSKYGSTAMAILIREKMIELGYLDE